MKAGFFFFAGKLDNAARMSSSNYPETRELELLQGAEDSYVHHERKTSTTGSEDGKPSGYTIFWKNLDVQGRGRIYKSRLSNTEAIVRGSDLLASQE